MSRNLREELETSEYGRYPPLLPTQGGSFGANRGNRWRNGPALRAKQGALSWAFRSGARYHSARPCDPSRGRPAAEVLTLDAGIETEILPLCRELGISYVNYAPVVRGFLTGTIPSQDALVDGDGRRNHPRFAPENFAQNKALLVPLQAVAAAHGCTMAQVAIAWTLAQGQVIVPIPGTERRPYLGENIAAAELSLTAEEMAALSAAFDPDVTAGDRYPEGQMKRVGI